MSKQRIPRWLTEGISVYEQKVARPEWARNEDMSFATFLSQKGAIKLKDLNAAFTTPRLTSIAYFEGSLLVDYLVKTFGDDGLRKLIRTYATGVDPDAAIREALGTSFEYLQGGFDQYLEQHFGDLRRAMDLPKDLDLTKMPADALRKYAADHPGSYPAQMVLGDALRKSGDADGAMQAFERAAAAMPVALGPDSPHAQMAEIALERNNRPRAVAELQAQLKSDFNDVASARKLAGLLKDAGVTDPATLRPVYERIEALDPYEADPHAALGHMAMARNDADLASREFRTVLALGPVDQAAAYTDLAESYFKGGKRSEAKKETLAALEIAPSYERAQTLLLQLAENRP
jgi:tetratricopeptide (TPR) repeat protein